MPDIAVPITDPDEINRLAAEFSAAGEAPSVEVTTTPSPKNTVNLPGGFLTNKRELIKVAEVRELTGADEEDLARASTPNRLLQTAFSRALVSLGSASGDDLDSLLSGDREAILLAIRIMTFGEELDLELVCPSCAEVRTYSLNLSQDVPIKELSDPISDRTFSVKIKAGDAVVTLPTVRTAKKLLDADDMTMPELVTTVLASCLVSLDGTPSLGVQTALNLGIVDREKLISEIYSRNPGPRLGEVKKACEACGADIPVPLSLAALFRI